ncbi:electron transfer flavoprotein subunit alpha/FixB family protein [Legionella israelensis]|uniref:Electron transfer flavoprotein subunit alpha n=1 Tax=Legionella israelensis TaxID=454 RepID=A0AAX1EFR2_9GAMM|nr:FAD-binding protein [Legionella israelensis]QBR83930.1 electron transfer flavoprotein subunit alpha/FixB family protein [Legionella israelensis]
MSLLILVEHDNQSMHPATRNTLAAALQLKEKPILLVIGSQCHSVAEQAASLAGVEAVWMVDDACYEHPLAEQICELILSVASSFDYFIAPASTFGKNIFPRLAAKLDVTQVSDVTRVIERNVFEHPVYAGNALETVRVLDNIKVLTVRTTAFEPVTENQPPCCIEKLDKVYPSSKSEFVRHDLSESVRPDLGSARIVVSGGRGLQNAENFKLVEELADVLGAAVGASRAAVDAGFVPNDYQVGQTGKVVAPSLYIAIGISGAIQHLAGMKDSKVIVAINKDEDAPIFQIADYGLVGDLFELVPQLIEELKQC